MHTIYGQLVIFRGPSIVTYPLVDSVMAIFVFPHLVRIVEFPIDSIGKVLVQTFDNDEIFIKQTQICNI